ncbi:hypothetical protein ACIKTA_04530 [Hansschlegelia beijingensis]
MIFSSEMWTLAEAAEAAGLSVATVRSWVQRGHINLDDDHLRAFTTNPHVLSLAAVWRLAVTARLVSILSIGPDRGWLLAGALATPAGDAGREPNELFAAGLSLLIVSSDLMTADVINVWPFTPFADIARAGTPVALIDLNQITEPLLPALRQIRGRRRSRAPVAGER